MAQVFNARTIASGSSDPLIGEQNLSDVIDEMKKRGWVTTAKPPKTITGNTICVHVRPGEVNDIFPISGTYSIGPAR